MEMGVGRTRMDQEGGGGRDGGREGRPRTVQPARLAESQRQTSCEDPREPTLHKEGPEASVHRRVERAVGEGGSCSVSKCPLSLV